MATTSRDARRRRIAERGTDRLALITGRLQTLPSSSSSSSPSESSHSHTASCPPSISHDCPPDLQSLLSHQSPVSTHIEDNPSASFLSKNDPGKPNNVLDSGRTSQPTLRKCETTNETSRGPVWEVNTGTHSSQPSSTIQTPPISASQTDHPLHPQNHRRNFFTSKQISTTIAATENLRISCSLTVAILVVLSCIGFPILGSRMIKSVVVLRPLYLLLLTNISIVLALLLSEKQRGFRRVEPEGTNVPVIGGPGLAEQVGNALELGLVLQNVMGAVFMDCSVYAVALICGLSVAQKLGW